MVNQRAVLNVANNIVCDTERAQEVLQGRADRIREAATVVCSAVDNEIVRIPNQIVRSGVRKAVETLTDVSDFSLWPYDGFVRDLGIVRQRTDELGQHTRTQGALLQSGYHRATLLPESCPLGPRAEEELGPWHPRWIPTDTPL